MTFKNLLKMIWDIKNILPKIDIKGALLIPFDLKVKDNEFIHYRNLPVNWQIKSVTSDDLPKEFSRNAVKIVDLFRRKTIDLDYEVMLIFDYNTGELVYCFVNEDDGDEVSGQVDENIFHGKNIAIIHNHPKNYGSAPSCENFQILSLNFQDYEILSSWDGIWTIESKDSLPFNEIENIKHKIQEFYGYSWEIVENCGFCEEEMIVKSDELFGRLLLRFINNSHLNIKLTKKEL